MKSLLPRTVSSLLSLSILNNPLLAGVLAVPSMCEVCGVWRGRAEREKVVYILHHICKTKLLVWWYIRTNTTRHMQEAQERCNGKLYERMAPSVAMS
jgi:hypothetical protein